MTVTMHASLQKKRVAKAARKIKKHCLAAKGR
jgi:hypothetical protein